MTSNIEVKADLRIEGFANISNRHRIRLTGRRRLHFFGFPSVPPFSTVLNTFIRRWNLTYSLSHSRENRHEEGLLWQMPIQKLYPNRPQVSSNTNEKVKDGSDRSILGIRSILPSLQEAAMLLFIPRLNPI